MAASVPEGLGCIQGGTSTAPQFMPQELQHSDDSRDSVKRARGRRGLHYEQGSRSKARGTCTAYECKGITHDFNFNKVALRHGVTVRNIDEREKSTEAGFLPGESMKGSVLTEENG